MSIFEHLTEHEVQILANSLVLWESFISEGDYVERQQNRFEVTCGTDPVEDRWKDAVASWHTGEANALLYLAYVRSQGAEAVLLFDVGSLPEVPPPYPTGAGLEYVVVTLGYEGHDELRATHRAHLRDRVGSPYFASFSGFHDAEESGPLDQDCVIFRVWDRRSDDFATFTVDGRDYTIVTLFFREHDHTGVVEWTETERFWADMEMPGDDSDVGYTLTPVTELPESWPRELRLFLAEKVLQATDHEGGYA